MVGDAVADIDRRDVRDWFASLRATPVAADRSMPVLSVIMREAEAMGLRPQGSNPCLGIRRYRHKGRARLLSDEEMRRLSARLSAHAGTSPQQVAVVRLLLLTECRKSEILTLRWSDYREGHLFLRDSKTGAKTIPLNGPALEVLAGTKRVEGNPYVITGTAEGAHLTDLQKPRRRVRKAAGLDDVRIHDLRHSCASYTVTSLFIMYNFMLSLVPSSNSHRIQSTS